MPTALTIEVPGRGTVSALVDRPAEARALYVLAHGAGAGMNHPFLAAMAEALAHRSVATLRYQFPYMEAGGRRTDAPPLAEATVAAAVRTALGLGLDVPVVAGGKSFGGRMTSQAAAHGMLGG